MTFNLRIEDDEDDEYYPEKWNRIRNNDPSLTHLNIVPKDYPAPSFYQNLAEALQYNTNITHLTIASVSINMWCIPNGAFDPIFESSNYIETLEIEPLGYDDENLAVHDDIFRSFVKSKNNKIAKLKIHLTEECVELLTTFLSANIDNQMLTLILQRTIGTEAASKISDELIPPNSIKALHLYEGNRGVSAAIFRPLLEAIGTITSLESLHIELYDFDHIDINLIALEKILFNNKKLKRLNLEMYEIEFQDLQKIALAIQKLPSLEYLLFKALVPRNPPNNVIIEDVIKKWFPMISNKYNLNSEVNGNRFLVYSWHPIF